MSFSHVDPEDFSGSANLTDYELERLLEKLPRVFLRDVRRLVTEVRTLRDQASEREFLDSQEIER